MAMNVDHAYYGWAHEESSDRDGFQEVSASQMLDHGSISFGRFAIESLSWERRSVFTHNKSQEELEKFKSPGLVAQKKAYFEEYYKRIRALKGMQENQQMEITLDYGGDGSISSQTGEEDETSAQHGSLEGGASNVIGACSKEASIEITLEKQLIGGAIQTTHLDLEPTSSNLDSSRKGLEEIEQEKNTGYVVQKQRLDTELTEHESLIKSKEDIEQHDLSGLNDKGISRKYGNSELHIEREKNSTYAIEIQNKHRESTVHESLVRTEEIEQRESKGISGKCDNLETIIEPEVSSEGPLLHPAKFKVVDLELKQDNNIVSEKIKPAKKDQLSFSKVKGPAASVRNGLNLEFKNQSDTKSSLGPKYPSQKKISKTKNSVGSSIETSDIVSRNYKSTSVASHIPLTEIRSNITIPRPFSFSTGRQTTVPDGIRDSAPRLSTKTSKRLASSLNQPPDVINVQGISKEAIVCGVKSRGLENRRVSEGVRKIALTLNSQSTNLKGRGANVSGQPKARSVNLPARNQSNPNVRSEYRSTNTIRNDILEQGKEDTRLREVRRADTKIAAPPRTGTPRATDKTAVPSRTDHRSLNGRNPRIGSLSHNGTKPRQEVPRWR